MQGKIRQIDRWGVRQLAFKVQKFNEGDYTVILFDADPSQIKSLEEMYKVIPEIFRHLILRREDLEKHPVSPKQAEEVEEEEGREGGRAQRRDRGGRRRARGDDTEEGWA